MKDKNVAGILALFLGGFGIHRFYLGQAGLGIFYMIFFLTPIPWIIGLVDAILFFSMDKEQFNQKYNKMHPYNRTDFAREGRYADRRTERDRYGQPDFSRQRNFEKEKETQRRNRPNNPPKHNPYKLSGIKKYKEYEYEEAIEDFQKALQINEKDIAVHFNLACSYSLTENVEKAFYHLDRAVAYGFNDFKKIKEHDALAFLRIQDQFEEFERNKFRLIQELEAPKEDLLNSVEGISDNNLLDQLKKLGELREKGLLTDEEFTTQKKKLLG